MHDDQLDAIIHAAFSNPALLAVDLGDLREVRRLMGANGTSLSDDELRHIRNLSRAWADTTFYWWLDRATARLADVEHQTDNECERPSRPPQSL